MKLELDSIRIDGGTQPRVSLDELAIDDFSGAMKSGEEFPPVVVFADGKDNWLADGFHRYYAAQKAGLEAIEADVRKGTQDDAVLWSVHANSDQNSLRRTNADKRRAVETILRRPVWSKWSDRQIARQCQVSHTFVDSIRSEFSRTSDASGNGCQMRGNGERLVERNGKTFAMATGDINRGRQRDPGDGTDDDLDEQTTTPAEPEQKDQAGRVIEHDELKAVFATRPEFTSLERQISLLKGEIEKLCKQPHARYLHRQEAISHLENARRCLRFATPHAICPYCGGEKCEACKQLGWMPEGVYEAVPSEVKA